MPADVPVSRKNGARRLLVRPELAHNVDSTPAPTGDGTLDLCCSSFPRPRSCRLDTPRTVVLQSGSGAMDRSASSRTPSYCERAW